MAKTLLDFAEKIDRLFPGHAFGAENIVGLFQAARRVHAFALKSCNEGLTPSEDKREDNEMARAKEYAEKMGFTIRFDGDVRGTLCRIDHPSGQTDFNWGGGIAVY